MKHAESVLQLAVLPASRLARLTDDERAGVLGGACFSHPADFPGIGDFPVLTVGMAPLFGSDPVCEIWHGREALQSGQHGPIRFRCGDTFLFGCLSLDEPDAAICNDARTPLQAATESAYRAIFSLLDARGYPAILRFWNYFPAINRESHRMERYRQFNIGRQDAFLAHGRSVIDRVPAACALGSVAGGLQIAFLAARADVVGVENPRQVSAYHYPSQYGPRSPTFARASLVKLGEHDMLFISGTASIVGHQTLHEGDVITIDGGNGNVYAGEVPTVRAEFGADMATLLKWADQVARLRVMANADTPEDAARAREFGAMGIGLCRTERMFNATDRLPIVQEMILAESLEERQAAIDRLLPIQRSDFKGIFKAMKGLPVTVRLMDPPLHEFLPTAAQLELEIAHLHHLRDSLKALEELPETLKLLSPRLYMQYADGLTKLSRGMTEFKDSHLEEDVIQKKEKTLKKVRALSEVNPMLGHRGVRLGITYPEIYSMQIQAILEAAALCAKEGIEVHPEIMVPQVATVEEMERIHSYVKRIHKVVELTHGINVGVKFGSMLEVVRACLRAGRMAQDAEFFSFGTNDLTQATFSFSREDAENKFLPHYNEVGILQDNPFEVLDQKGVGELMKLAVAEGRKTRADLKVGICGEHGGHPASIAFCHRIGLDYVSCSGPRVPIARLAAAQAQLLDNGGQVVKNA